VIYINPPTHFYKATATDIHTQHHQTESPNTTQYMSSMRVIPLIVLLQSVQLCAASPLNLQPATLATKRDRILSLADVLSRFEHWLKPNPPVNVKNTENSLYGNDSEKCHQCKEFRCARSVTNL